MSDRCEVTEASCECFRLKEHTGFHCCTCSGQWMHEDGVFKVGSFPAIGVKIEPYD